MTTMTPPEPQVQRSVSEALRRPVKLRPTPLSARGEPAMWFMAMSLILCIVLITGLLGRTLWEGLQTFWPSPIEKLTLASGKVVMGIETKVEVDPATKEKRTLVRTGNREIGEPFVWIDEKDVKSREFPKDAVFLERREWGAWIGEPKAVLKIEKEAKSTVAEGVAAWESFNALHKASEKTQKEILKLTQDELGWINTKMERERLKVRQAEIEASRTSQGESGRLNWMVWGVMAAASGALIAGAVSMRKSRSNTVAAVRVALVVVGVAAGIGLFLEAPWRNRGVSSSELEALRTEAVATQKGLEAEYQGVLQKIERLQAENLKYRFVVIEAGGKIAPTRQGATDDPMFVSQVVRAVRPNDLSVAGKIGVYLSRWGEYLGDAPRNANTEGGVFPVIFGTVVMTLLLSLMVVPLGVIAALYLREYAKQGIVTSAIRVAVNNLAGVPSIVYGVFGLGFFCYTLGAYVDRGPTQTNVIAKAPWWWILAGLAMLVAFALAVGGYLRRSRHADLSTLGRAMGPIATVAWIGAAVLLGLLFITTPYFHGFFEASLPSPTFGQRGLLWGSLTLAILTLPVVIVATEEAIAAVPKTMREGSYGAGASKWQTIWRIVLPQAMPGIMTGMILAMARGAGEVAPLMLVGAVKSAPDLPISSHAPFIHPERSFMHLGFHIYDLGFQSADSEAARPLVWTTTLLLIVIVLLLNFAAITIRGRLRARLVGSAV